MTRAPVLFVGIASLAIGAGLAWWFKPTAPEQPPPLKTIESMGHIVSVRVNFSDVIDFTLPRAVDIPGTPYEIRYGGTTVLPIAKGDCSLATDLRLAKKVRGGISTGTSTVLNQAYASTVEFMRRPKISSRSRITTRPAAITLASTARWPRAR